ncbi:hypothetical protein [Agarilytica rhodophyticola]|uniref:hypothetical protein n=1 Tax=Agarilytica rhodophyticola TaxID=1737490 RepID=UPI000B347595|nr:hypothetical protein [Agarilytica rhodophyticola]
MRRVLGILLLLCGAKLYAHTWNEPWHKEVVAKSTVFGLYEVVKSSRFVLKLKLVKHLAGEKTKKRVSVSNYYLYERASLASELDDHPFNYRKGQKVYVFLKNEGKKYSIATPTAGIDEVMHDGSVAATYRHSLHRAKANPQDYELLQTCIFNHLHSLKCSLEALDIINNALKEPVGILSETASDQEADRFFRQHGALEASYILSLNHSIERIQPFLDSQFFHVQTSAVRALWASDIVDKEERLVSFIKSPKKDGMARVMAVVLLNDSSSKNTVEILRQYVKDASEEEVYLGGSLMDPRIGTWFPESIKAAIEWFLAKKQSL